MADYIPFEIQAEIMKKLPVKSLIRFRSVSKPWKFLIDSSKFIAGHHVCHTEPQHLLVSYVDPDDYKQKYVSIVDDNDSFLEHKFSLTVPIYIKDLNEVSIVGSSRGLICIFGSVKRSVSGTKMAVIWNPSIRKSVAIVVPNVLNTIDVRTIVGFGVCPHTSDPKLVKITQTNDIPRQVEVFTLSSGAWRILSTNLTHKSIVLTRNQVVIDGFIYWHAYRWELLANTYVYRERIISFDITSEEFTEINLPDSVLLASNSKIVVSKLMESLVVLKSVIEGDKEVYGLWTMEHGFTKSFTKLLTINPPDVITKKVVGFRKNGEPLIEVLTDPNSYWNTSTLKVYEPYSDYTYSIGIIATPYSLLASSYMETLLLLDY